MKLRTTRSILFGLLATLPLVVSAHAAFADDDSDDDTEEVADTDEDTTVDGGYADTDPSAVTVFRSELQPYGVWVVDPVYGTVWVPSGAVVGADFAPYQTAGHWEMTDDGEWLWVSDYSWGYIPFHYGRWVWIDGTGWGWIPGRAYAPSWVVWRVGGDGYIGWAPMPPAFYWVDDEWYYIESPPPAAYVFCETHYVYDSDVHSHIIRDRAEVRRAADGTHRYRGNPTRKYGPSYPTSGEAHVAGLTAKRSPGDSKAMKLAKPAPHAQGSSASPGSSASRAQGSSWNATRANVPAAPADKKETSSKVPARSWSTTEKKSPTETQSRESFVEPEARPRPARRSHSNRSNASRPAMPASRAPSVTAPSRPSAPAHPRPARVPSSSTRFESSTRSDSSSRSESTSHASRSSSASRPSMPRAPAPAVPAPAPAAPSRVVVPSRGGHRR